MIFFNYNLEVAAIPDPRSGCRLKHLLQPASRYHTTPPQPNHNVTPTHIAPEQYNPCDNSTNKSQTPEDGCINIRNMLIIK